MFISTVWIYNHDKICWRYIFYNYVCAFLSLDNIIMVIYSKLITTNVKKIKVPDQITEILFSISHKNPHVELQKNDRAFIW